tara:strand:+ start:18 stop:389 length:372 start_codon:yes stop_codon:yes gene_type:complete
MQIIELIGRIFISLVFLIAGFGKIFSYENTIDYMESFGVPGYLLIPAIIVEILFPLLVIIGYKTKSSALILALFSLLLALVFHTDFSNQMQLMSFLKNLALSGGFLIVFINGAGKFSIDQRFK